MNSKLVSACALAGIALTVFGANSASAEETNKRDITTFIVANQPVPPSDGSPTATPPPAPDGTPTATPPSEGTPPGAPTTSPAPPATGGPQVPVKPEGAADTGSLDAAPSTDEGPGAGVLALGGVALLGAGGLGVAAYRRRQRA